MYLFFLKFVILLLSLRFICCVFSMVDLKPSFFYGFDFFYPDECRDPKT